MQHFHTAEKHYHGLVLSSCEIKSSILKFEKPIPKGAVKLIPEDKIDELIDLLHNEANVI